MEAEPRHYPKSIGRQLNFAGGAAAAVCNKLLEPHGLSLAQWAIISSIWRNGDLSVKALAELTGNAPPATSRIVDRMVSAGLLIRRPDPKDRRAVTVGVSETGAALRHLAPIYKEVNAVMLQNLSDAEQQILYDLLARVEQNGRNWLGDRP